VGEILLGVAETVPNLKNLRPEIRVQAIGYCHDTYRVTTADGRTRDFWERNLRFKTDSGNDGPEKGAPALVGAGMMGDRADVIFADPRGISTLIVGKCWMGGTDRSDLLGGRARGKRRCVPRAGV